MENDFFKPTPLKYGKFNTFFLRLPLSEIAQILNPKKLPLTIRVKLMAFDFCHKKQLFDKIMVSGTYFETRP